MSGSFKRIQPDVPNVLNPDPRPPKLPERVRFTIRLDPWLALELDTLEDRIDRYRLRDTRYSSTKAVRTISLLPQTHEWMKQEAERCGMTLGRFTGKILSDPDLDPVPPDPEEKLAWEPPTIEEWTEPDPFRAATQWIRQPPP